MNIRLHGSLVFLGALLAFGCEQEPKATTNQTSSTKATAPETSSKITSKVVANTSTRPKIHEPLTKRGILEKKLSELKTSEQRHELLTGHEWVTSFKDNEHETYVKLHDGSEIDITYHRKGTVPHL